MMIRTAAGLKRAVLSALTPLADPETARGAQRYLRSAMPCFGIRADDFRRALKPVFADVPLADADAWRTLVLGLFRGATYRDEWWAAGFLAGDRRARGFQTMDALPMYEEMIVTAAWWDVVDDLATHRLSAILLSEPRPMKRAMRAWSRGESLWKRRSAILCQIPLKKETDLGFLYSVIEPSLGSKEFFLRKAIGWALRQYAWTDPDEVVRYVDAHRARLSGLSIREALKNVLPA
jgi:3-methyladenine DNA glycosylase AlkD